MTIAALGRLPEADEFSAGHGDREPLRIGEARVRTCEARDRNRRNGRTSLNAAPRTFSSTWPWGDSDADRRCRFFLSAFNEIFERSSAAIHNACRLADEVLFQAGKPELVDEACRKSPVGKLLPNALYVHRSALEGLSPLLRVYEGCARAYLGEIDGANLIKLHRQSGKVSYLVYPDFETDPHPALVRSVKLSLRTREIDCLEYNASPNPPILHRKETFLAADHPLYAKFARLTQQEEKHGLLEDTATIGTRDGWQARLERGGVQRFAGIGWSEA